MLYTHTFIQSQDEIIQSMTIELEFASVYLDWFCLQSFDDFIIVNEQGIELTKNLNDNYIFDVMANRQITGILNNNVILGINTIGIGMNFEILNSYSKSVWLDCSTLTVETSPAPVPEPATAMMMLIGISLFSIRRFFRKKR